ncbi:hypothetical protein PESP_a2225 [Pseudoalteromonas espejiana DSM 9414]|nr:hypothetical protein PESP_a2225 [Pseudoalteromonas espejiana DSM 9414]
MGNNHTSSALPCLKKRNTLLKFNLERTTDPSTYSLTLY